MATEDPPPCGAQQRQDAVWKGGNEALPPLWHQFKVGDGTTWYQDDTLIMASRNRPLPGVRLDEPGQLLPGCEWHISPVGRSYFVIPNARTTSWKKPTPGRPPGSAIPLCIIEGHSMCIQSLACVGIGCNIISASYDGSIRQWRRDGRPIGGPWGSDGAGVSSLSVSVDETMVVSGSGDGRLRLWNIKEGSMVGNPWEGHTATVETIDWSPNAQEVASGSKDGTMRRWNPRSGRPIAPPVETGHGSVFVVKYSPEGEKLASGGADNMIRLWSKDGDLLMETKGHEDWVNSLCWSKDGAYIFSASSDRTIRKWQSIDLEELVVLRGHTNGVTSLCLSPDERHLVSTSYAIRVWDLKTNQQVGDPLMHDDELWDIAISPDGKYVIGAGVNAKIYVWSLEAALMHWGGDRVHSAQNGAPDARLKARFAPSRLGDQVNKRDLARYGDNFWGDNTNTAPRLPAPSRPRQRSLFDLLRVGTRSANAPKSIPLQSRRWNFSLFHARTLPRKIDVAHARDEDRYAIAPPSEAEVATAMQYASSNMFDTLTPQVRVVGTRMPRVGARGPPAEVTQGQNSFPGIEEESSYMIGCCGSYRHLAHRQS